MNVRIKWTLAATYQSMREEVIRFIWTLGYTFIYTADNLSLLLHYKLFLQMLFKTLTTKKLFAGKPAWKLCPPIFYLDKLMIDYISFISMIECVTKFINETDNIKFPD